MKNVVFGASRLLPPPKVITDAPYAKAFSFFDNEPIDDVTERFAAQPFSGTAALNAQITSKQLVVTNNAVRQLVCGDSYYIAPNTPFSIQAKANISNIWAAGGALLAVWDESVTTERSWIFQVLPTGAVNFSITNNRGANISICQTPAGAVTLGQDVHLAVERDAANLVSIYVNGVKKAFATISIGSSDILTPVYVRRDWTGKVWDMCIADKVVFGGEFTPPVKMVREEYPLKYTSAELQNIVAQFAQRRDDHHNEITGMYMQFFGLAQIRTGQIQITAAGDYYTSDINYFGAADFTYEMKFKVNTLPGTQLQLPSHWSDSVTADARLRISVTSGGAMIVGLKGVGGTFVQQVISGVVTAGVTYHFVMERIGSAVNFYINGVNRLTMTVAGALPDTTGWKIMNNQPGTPTSSHAVWDIRIAKVALYKGVIKPPKVLPKPLVHYSVAYPRPGMMRTGSLQAGSNLWKGFAKNITHNGVLFSCGELWPQLYWNTTQNRMIRIKGVLGITVSGTSYLYVWWQFTNEPRKSDTPTMTNKFKIGTNGTIFDWAAGTTVTPVNNNDQLKLWTTPVAATEFANDESIKDITFV